MAKAKEGNLKGWCIFTDDDTFKGHLEGDRVIVEGMVNWLEKKGDHTSKIKKATFLNFCSLREAKYKEFKVRKKEISSENV